MYIEHHMLCLWSSWIEKIKCKTQRQLKLRFLYLFILVFVSSPEQNPGADWFTAATCCCRCSDGLFPLTATGWRSTPPNRTSLTGSSWLLWEHLQQILPGRPEHLEICALLYLFTRESESPAEIRLQSPDDFLESSSPLVNKTVK